MKQRWQDALLIATFALPMFSASLCTSRSPSPTPSPTQPPPQPTPIDVTASDGDYAEGVLQVSVEQQASVATVVIGRIPPSTELKCFLDTKELPTCQSGMTLGDLAPGAHFFVARALDKGEIKAVGAVKIAVTSIGRIGGISEPLPAVRFTDEGLIDGATVTMGKPLTINFAVDAPGCDVKLRCRLDRPYLGSWLPCTHDSRYELSAGLVAGGLQSLTVQPYCGDRYGASVTRWWYGVPADYQPLSVRMTRDKERVHVNLWRPADCPLTQLQLECATAEENVFKSCGASFTLEKPVAGHRVRASCLGKAGPHLTL